jgi:hypothetical protein
MAKPPGVDAACAWRTQAVASNSTSRSSATIGNETETFVPRSPIIPEVTSDIPWTLRSRADAPPLAGRAMPIRVVRDGKTRGHSHNLALAQPPDRTRTGKDYVIERKTTHTARLPIATISTFLPAANAIGSRPASGGVMNKA